MLATIGRMFEVTLNFASDLLKKLVGYALLFVVIVFLIITSFSYLLYSLATR